MHTNIHTHTHTQVLVQREPGLMGHMFDVEITSTGKHYLVGEVVKHSLVRMPSRPAPLPYGAVSGWVKVQESRERRPRVAGWLTDSTLLALAILLICFALFVHSSDIALVLGYR